MELHNIELKRAELKDIDFLVDIKKRAFKEEFKRHGFTPEEMISVKWHRDILNTSIYYKILNSREIVGGVNIFTDGSGKCYLGCIFVDKKVQNCGVGTKVIGDLESLHRDCNKWTLDTPTNSRQNHHFYEKLGYKHVGDMTPKGAPEGFSLRLYEKSM